MTDEEIRVECLKIAVQISKDYPECRTPEGIAKDLYKWVKEAEQVEKGMSFWEDVIYSYDNTKECSTENLK